MNYIEPSTETAVTQALALVSKIEQHIQQFYARIERAFILPYEHTQAQNDAKHISRMITQLEQILDGVNLTFTLDSKFDINMQQVIQQLRIETEESKKTLNTIAKSATTVMEQVARFDVLQYQHEENIEE